MKLLVVILFLLGAFLEFVKVEIYSKKVELRKDITSTLSGMIFALIGLLIWLFG